MNVVLTRLAGGLRKKSNDKEHVDKRRPHDATCTCPEHGRNASRAHVVLLRARVVQYITSAARERSRAKPAKRATTIPGSKPIKNNAHKTGTPPRKYICELAGGA